MSHKRKIGKDEQQFLDQFRRAVVKAAEQFIADNDGDSAGGSWWADCDHYNIGENNQLCQFADWLLAERGTPAYAEDNDDGLTLSDLAERMDDLELKVDKLSRPGHQRR